MTNYICCVRESGEREIRNGEIFVLEVHRQLFRSAVVQYNRNRVAIKSRIELCFKDRCSTHHCVFDFYTLAGAYGVVILILYSQTFISRSKHDFQCATRRRGSRRTVINNARTRYRDSTRSIATTCGNFRQREGRSRLGASVNRVNSRRSVNQRNKVRDGICDCSTDFKLARAWRRSHCRKRLPLNSYLIGC